jgi:hypothetical protein
MSWEGTYYLNQNVEIQAFFVDAGVPVIGAAATIVIYKPSDAPGAPTVNGAAMSELGGGIYNYAFAGSDEAGLYAVRCAIVASGLYAGGSFRVMTNPFIALTALVAAVQADVTTLLANLAAAQADITALAGDVANVFAEVNGIKDGGTGDWDPATDTLHEIKAEIVDLLSRWNTQAF